MNLRDAQDNPGGGKDQSAAGSPPAGSQTSVREHAARAGDPRQDNLEASNALDYRG